MKKVRVIKEILPFEILPEIKLGNEIECDKDGGITIFYRDSDCFHFGARQVSLMISSKYLEEVKPPKEKDLHSLLIDYFSTKKYVMFKEKSDKSIENYISIDQVVSELMKIVKDNILKVYDKKTKGNRHLNYVDSVREDLEDSFNESQINIS